MIRPVLELISSVALAVALVVGPGHIDKAGTEQVVLRLEQALRDVYVFPDVGEKTASYLAGRLASGAYDSAVTPLQLSTALTADLRSFAHDKHLGVWFTSSAEDGAKGSKPRGDEARTRDFGIQKVEHLRGNVGYLDLRSFDDPEAGAATISGAMSILSNADAVIIDLRSNGGGKPSGVQYVASYFFREPQHFSDIYHREGHRTDQLWTLPVLEGKRMPGVPLFLLTSSRTFSGGEAFAYAMQSLKRATVVGEVTSGGANPGRAISIGAGFEAFIPNGRVIDPVTHTNWEGTGVKPDIEVVAEKAFDTAYVKALETIAAHAATADERAAIEEVLKSLKQ